MVVAVKPSSDSFLLCKMLSIHVPAPDHPSIGDLMDMLVHVLYSSCNAMLESDT